MGKPPRRNWRHIPSWLNHILCDRDCRRPGAGWRWAAAMNYESRDYHRHIYISYVRLFWVGGTCECLTISAKIYANLKLWIFYSFLLHVHTPAVNVSLSFCSLLYHLRFYLFPIFGECINKSLKGSLFGEEQKLNESATDISEQKARDIYDNSSLLSHRRFSVKYNRFKARAEGRKTYNWRDTENKSFIAPFR